MALSADNPHQVQEISLRDLADFGLAAETIVNLFIIELGQLGDGDALQFGNLDVVDVGVFAQGLLVKLAAGVFFQLLYQGLASPFFRTDLETEQDVLVVVLEARRSSSSFRSR
jgi:hypothetical protein